jgi:hypothetical protein
MNAEDVARIGIETFNQTKEICVWFLLPLFLLRVTFGAISGDSQGIIQAIKGAAFFYILLSIFPSLLEFIFLVPADLGVNVFSNSLVRPEKVSDSVPWMLKEVVSAIAGAIYWFCYALLIIVVVLLASFAPIVFLFSTTFGVGFGLKVFFGLLVAAASWPIVWVSLDKTFQLIIQNSKGTFSDDVIEIAFLGLKAIGPLSLGWMGMSSGPGQMAVGFTSGLVQKSFGSAFSKGKNTSYSSATPLRQNPSDRFKERLASGLNRLSGRSDLNPTANPWRHNREVAEALRNQKRESDRDLLQKHGSSARIESALRESTIGKSSSSYSDTSLRSSHSSLTSSQVNSNQTKSSTGQSMARENSAVNKPQETKPSQSFGSNLAQVSASPSPAHARTQETAFKVPLEHSIKNDRALGANRRAIKKAHSQAIRPYDESRLKNFEDDQET